MSYTLYGCASNPRTQACQVTAQFEAIDLKLSPINLATKDGLDESYFSKFPHSQGKIPALEGPSINITESVAIAHYLASLNSKANLLGRSKEQAAEVLQWALFFSGELLPAMGQQVLVLAPFNRPYNRVAVTDAEKKAAGIFTVIEKLLQYRTYFVGERITLADIFLAAHLTWGFNYILDASWRSQFPNIFRHYQTLVHQSAFATVLGGEPTLIEKRIVYSPPKKEKAPAPAAAAPKAEKKAKDDEDDEPLVPAEPKAKHPCEALGPAKCFPFDEWKRQYSNSKFPDAMKWLEEHIDLSEYSFVKVTYKYNEDLTQVFMSANLIGGFHNRLEASRKYLFGSAGVYGKANASKIQGAYMIRGSDPLAVFNVAPDWESYDFEMLDFKKDIDFIKGCWNWDNTFDGLEYADGKVFK
ncbi:hypothetical protein CROQUDRAFT_279056 [Cronartium quercuum f. sp. fusiforme G11]|uniref:Elongation factor 1-gamma n=1 Tax=Cronartium quercuum f. sp. fusiforme G11 TaxID=708437 RepID=A0A9P6TFG2_9BASI|nr:hypothetical protein CROQUDRAFT_279056 [Cronartium quercuum f. sp. fusiforme G11]